MAFLVCMESDDVYIRYSALVNLLQYVSSALNRADSELYAQVYRSHYPAALRAELSAYSKFFDEYRQSTASTVVGAVNDTFLQSQGQTPKATGWWWICSSPITKPSLQIHKRTSNSKADSDNCPLFSSPQLSIKNAK